MRHASASAPRSMPIPSFACIQTAASRALPLCVLLPQLLKHQLKVAREALTTERCEQGRETAVLKRRLEESKETDRQLQQYKEDYRNLQRSHMVAHNDNHDFRKDIAELKVAKIRFSRRRVPVQCVYSAGTVPVEWLYRACRVAVECPHRVPVLCQ
jgi:septal ring factor EnvC (AmiA/AmiB activator)